MILVAFVLFAILLAGWLFAPAGKEQTSVKTVAAPSLQFGEAVA